MKKIRLLTSLLTIPAIIVPATSCSKKTDAATVTLVGYTDPSVVGVDGKDFWLAAEPAASVRTKAASLHNVGNLQSLYGGQGFNQAVLVCKKDIWENNTQYLKQIEQHLENNLGYISNPDNLNQIIQQIIDNQTPGRSSVLSKSNTTTQSLINSNPKHVETSTDVISYMDFN